MALEDRSTIRVLPVALVLVAGAALPLGYSVKAIAVELVTKAAVVGLALLGAALLVGTAVQTRLPGLLSLVPVVAAVVVVRGLGVLVAAATALADQVLLALLALLTLAAAVVVVLTALEPEVLAVPVWSSCE